MSTIHVSGYAPSSGQIIGIVAFDASGNLTPITSYNPLASQTIEVNAATGTWRAGFLGSYTAPLPLGASPATVQSAMQALPTVGANNLTFDASVGFPYKGTFRNALAGLQPLITLSVTGLSATGATPTLASGTGPIRFYDATIATGNPFALVGSGWVPYNPTAFGATYVVPSTGTGLNSAKWSIPALNTGTYNVYWSNSALTGSGISRTTPWRFSDGSIPRQIMKVNQQTTTPTVVLPGSPAGFELLATVALTNPDTLNILVTDETDPNDINNLVCVNQVAIVPIDVTVARVFAASDTSNVYVTLTGTWQSFGSGWNNAENFSSQPGSSLWQFTGLLSNAKYAFQIQWTEGGNRTTAATYTVLDSDMTTVLGTATFNQQLAIIGNYPVNATYKDRANTPFPFTNIGTFTVSGTVAYILLPVSNDGSNLTMSEGAACLLSSAHPYLEPVSSSVQNYSTGPASISINGGSDIALTNALVRTTLPTIPVMDFVLFDRTLLSTDNLTLTIGNNCITTSAGTLQGFTHQSIINKVGLGNTITSSAPPNQIDRTTEIGFNQMALGDNLPMYSNLFKNCHGLQYNGSAPVLPAKNANGYPQSISLDSWSVLFGSATSPQNSKGYPLYTNGGTTTITFDGSAGGHISVIPFTGTTIQFLSANTSHATGNVIQVIISTDGSGDTLAPVFTVAFNLCYMTVDDADTGAFSTTGSWSVQSSIGYNGSIHKNNSSGGSVATFSLGSVPGGTYSISHTWPVNASNCNNVTVNVRESGGSPIATYTLDQTAAPSGAPATHDYNYNVFNFGTGGHTFPCTGGPITVELSGDTSGPVIADAVQISLIGNLTSGIPFAPWSNLGLFDPMSGWPNQPKFHPLYVKAMRGAKSARNMQLMGANQSCIKDYADFSTSNTFAYGNGATQNLYAVTKVEEYGNPNGFFKSTNKTALFTLASINGSPLPLISGVPLLLPSPLSTNCSGGGSVFWDFLQASVEHDPGIMASNQVAMGTGSIFGCVGTIVTLLPTMPATSLGTATTSLWSIPPRDYFEFCYLIDIDPWFNVTAIVTQACVTQLADDYMSVFTNGLTRLGKPAKIRLETGNEPWNFSSGYPYYIYYVGMANTTPFADSQTAYAFISSQRQGWCHTELAAHGRGNELIRVYNAQFGNPSTAGSVLAYLNNNGQPIDEICTAVYLGLQPANQPGLNSIYDNMTAAQIIDCLDLYFTYGNFFIPEMQTYRTITEQQTVASGRHCGLSGYEGFIGSLEIGGSTCSIVESQAIAGLYWPQIYYLSKAIFANYQSYGNFTQFNIYSLDQPAVNDGGGCIDSTYGKNMWYTFEPGIGDGSDGKHDNRPDLLGGPPAGPNWLTNVTPTAAAVQWWNGLSATSNAPIFAYLRQSRNQ